MNKFKIYLDARGEYRWRLIARNGEIVAVGEGYTNKYNARRAVERIREIAANAYIEE